MKRSRWIALVAAALVAALTTPARPPAQASTAAAVRTP